MSLKARLIEQIALEGPMSVADYMARCLLDPLDGYYSRRPALGAEGDFITAPLISQMFGEMIGVWVAQTWLALGSPAAFRLVEIGGGDGTLMTDILRVAKQVPGLHDAAQVVMIEPSLPLRMVQSQAVPGAIFLPDVDALPQSLPLIIIANEVLDCLPARQYVRTEDGWHERLVGLRNNDLCFGLSAEASPAVKFEPANPGDVVEYSAEQVRFTAACAHKLKATSGAMLLIDYGRDASETGDTLQALSHHEKRDPLDSPGLHDLTVWADFPLVAATASSAGLKVSPVVAQHVFLQRLGIATRLDALETKNPDQAAKLRRQYERLMAPDQMGELFKVVAFAFPPELPLFALEASPPSP